jgi:hypothetical protein
MSKIIILLMLFLACSATATCASDQDEKIYDWVIYVCVGSDYISLMSPQERASIPSDWHFPLYAGYFYTLDSKVIKWHSEVPIVDSMMKFWAETYTNYPLYMYNIEIDGQHSWQLGTPGFLKAAVVSMNDETSLRVIRYEKNVPIDRSWKPQFKKQVSFEGSVMSLKKGLSYLDGDYNPINWDQSKNNY